MSRNCAASAAAMDAVFHMHHFAHAQNDLTQGQLDRRASSGKSRPPRQQEAGRRSMKLEYTPEQRAFRAEVRAWMEANVPKARLPSFDLTQRRLRGAPRLGAQAERGPLGHGHLARRTVAGAGSI